MTPANIKKWNKFLKLERKYDIACRTMASNKVVTHKEAEAIIYNFAMKRYELHDLVYKLLDKP